LLYFCCGGADAGEVVEVDFDELDLCFGACSSDLMDYWLSAAGVAAE